MSAKLNFASKPFRNRTLPWMITAIITGVSLIALVYIISQSRALRASADTLAANLVTLRKQEAELVRLKEEINQALAPEQRQLLDAAHSLVDRKQFYWSRLFADLEAVLPGNVRVVRINVRDVFLRGGQTYAELELTVMSKAPTDVTNMISEMDNGGVFQAEPISQNLAKGSGGGGMEWVLRVIYKPRAGAPVNPVQPTSVASAASNGGVR